MEKNRVKIKLTKDIVAYLKKDDKKPVSIKAWTIIFADELKTSDFWSFANITNVDIKESKKEEKKVVEELPVIDKK